MEYTVIERIKYNAEFCDLKTNEELINVIAIKFYESKERLIQKLLESVSQQVLIHYPSEYGTKGINYTPLQLKVLDTLKHYSILTGIEDPKPYDIYKLNDKDGIDARFSGLEYEWLNDISTLVYGFTNLVNKMIINKYKLNEYSGWYNNDYRTLLQNIYSLRKIISGLIENENG